MSLSKRYYEDVSERMGLGGEINEAVFAKAQEESCHRADVAKDAKFDAFAMKEYRAGKKFAVPKTPKSDFDKLKKLLGKQFSKMFSGCYFKAGEYYNSRFEYYAAKFCKYSNEEMEGLQCMYNTQWWGNGKVVDCNPDNCKCDLFKLVGGSDE